MTLLVDVLEEHGLDSIDVVLFALPGVGDVGKNAVELLNEANDARGGCTLHSSWSDASRTIG